MALLRIRNNTEVTYPLPPPLGILTRFQIREVAVTVDDIERLRSTLLVLDNAGVISFDVLSDAVTESERETEFMPVAGTPAAITLAGDITGPGSETAVSAIAGVAVDLTGHSDGKVLGFADGSIKPVDGGGGTLAGDVTGDSGSNTVERIRGVNVVDTSPNEDDVLFSQIAGWTPRPLGYGRLPILPETKAMWYFDGDLLDASENGYALSIASGSTNFSMGPKRRLMLAPHQPLTLSAAAPGLLLNANLTFEFVGRGCPVGDAVLATSGDNTGWSWSVNIQGSGKAVQALFSPNEWGYQTLEATYTLPVNETYYIAVTYTTSTDTTMQIFINRRLAGATTFPGEVPIAGNNTFFALCYHSGASSWWHDDGLAQAMQMHVCDRVLTADEIAARGQLVLPPGY